MKSRGLSERQN